jgi:transcription elongation factor GreA
MDVPHGIADAVAARRGDEGDPMSEVFVTREGLERLTLELARLRRDRQDVVARIRDALDHGGDGAENGEWLLVREEQEQLDARIADLEERRRLAVIVEPEDDGEVDIGERVLVRDLRSGALRELRIVGTGEDDPDAGSISPEAPIGAALLGRRAGDIVTVAAPAGELRFEIVRVEG